jgi:hypothetical protein
MRAKEFITESHGSLTNDVARALPGTYVITDLPNSDFYKQYRFGVALAVARGRITKTQNDLSSFDYSNETPWGENLVVSSYMEPDIEKVLDTAMKLVGVSGKKLISTKNSEESVETAKKSPINPFKGYKKK